MAVKMSKKNGQNIIFYALIILHLNKVQKISTRITLLVLSQVHDAKNRSDIQLCQLCV